MNEVQENKVEEVSNENEFVVELDENQETTSKETQSENKEQTIVRTEESDEHESYSEKVQKRIDALTAKRKAAEDDANNAITYGKQVEEENKSCGRGRGASTETKDTPNRTRRLQPRPTPLMDGHLDRQQTGSPPPFDPFSPSPFRSPGAL